LAPQMVALCLSQACVYWPPRASDWQYVETEITRRFDLRMTRAWRPVHARL
jgi:hypothetical protein